MQPSGGSPLPKGYREGLQAQTLRLGLLFASLAVVAILVFAVVERGILRTRGVGGWAVVGLLPSLVFLLGGVTLFRGSPGLTVPFHLATLVGVTTMVCGYSYAIFLDSRNPDPTLTTSAILLFACIFFVYVFAAGARRFLAAAIGPPLGLFSIMVAASRALSATGVLHLAAIWVFAAAGCIVSIVEERVRRREFAVRTAEARRRQRAEREITQIRRRNLRLEREINERQVIEAELERRAAMDDLTDTYNRRTGIEILTRSLYLAQRNQQPLSVCFVDVDDLKAINDRFGHAEGDRLLQHVITILRKHLRKSDFVSRIGGDEFIMVLPDCSRESADYIMDRISSDLSREARSPYRVSVSMGVAEYVGDRAIDPASLINEADASMYRSKQAKKRRQGPARS